MEQQVNMPPSTSAILPPQPRPLYLVPIPVPEEPVSPGDETGVALPAILPRQEEPCWQDLSPEEQNMLMHRLLYPEWDPEQEGVERPRNYVGDLNLMRFLMRWANSEWRAFKFEIVGKHILRRMINRLGRPAEYGDTINVESGLEVLEPGDVCYALLETYGPFCPDMMVPSYREAWHKIVIRTV